VAITTEILPDGVEALTACPCCGGQLAKLGEDITETLEVVPRQWKVVQTVREKFTCRRCEKITQPPAPFHTIARGRAGASLLALMILYAKYGHHQPLNRQSESFTREGIDLDVSTMADWVGACTASLAPLVELIRLHVLGAARLHGDDTTVPVLAKGKTMTGRCGAMCATTSRLPDRHRPPQCSSIPAPATASTRTVISPAMAGSSRPTLAPVLGPARAGPGGWVQWALRRHAKSAADHRGRVHEPRAAEILCPGRSCQVSPGQETRIAACA
jgi:transposase